MTESQLIKLKNRLLNVQTQLQGGTLVLGGSTTEQNIKARLETAIKKVKECYELTDGIETHEPTKAENQRAKKRKEGKYSDLVAHTVIIHREGTPTYNIQCCNYGEYRDRNNKVIERTCTVGMDMCYCSKNCAYATNNVCSLKG